MGQKQNGVPSQAGDAVTPGQAEQRLPRVQRLQTRAGDRCQHFRWAVCSARLTWTHSQHGADLSRGKTPWPSLRAAP